MSRVEEIENAIDSLGPDEFKRIARWFREGEQQRWDEQRPPGGLGSKCTETTGLAASVGEPKSNNI